MYMACDIRTISHFFVESECVKIVSWNGRLWIVKGTRRFDAMICRNWPYGPVAKHYLFSSGHTKAKKHWCLKMVYISPFEFQLQNGRPCAPFQGLSRLKLRWTNGDGPGILYPELGNCILCVFNVSVVERPLKIESHFVAREFAHRKTTCKNPISFCSRVSCPSEGNMWKPNLILSNHFQSSFCRL